MEEKSALCFSLGAVSFMTLYIISLLISIWRKALRRGRHQPIKACVSHLMCFRLQKIRDSKLKYREKIRREFEIMCKSVLLWKGPHVNTPSRKLFSSVCLIIPLSLSTSIHLAVIDEATSLYGNGFGNGT